MSAKTTAKITVNGCLRIKGDFVIQDMDGKPFDLAGRSTIGLCRCGHSEDKPFCDGAHRKLGCESPCPARDLPPPRPK